MSRWAREHPEQMEAISNLPTSTEQLEALRAAMSPLVHDYEEEAQ